MLLANSGKLSRFSIDVLKDLQSGKSTVSLLQYQNDKYSKLELFVNIFIIIFCILFCPAFLLCIKPQCLLRLPEHMYISDPPFFIASVFMIPFFRGSKTLWPLHPQFPLPATCNFWLVLYHWCLQHMKNSSAHDSLAVKYPSQDKELWLWLHVAAKTIKNTSLLLNRQESHVSLLQYQNEKYSKLRFFINNVYSFFYTWLGHSCHTTILNCNALYAKFSLPLFSWSPSLVAQWIMNPTRPIPPPSN